MNLLDSRRLTGPNILWRRPSAVIDVALEDSESGERLIAAWKRHARRLLDAVGFAREDLATRDFAHGVSLALSAPIDALYAATEVNEHAYESAAAELAGRGMPDLTAAAESLRQAIAAERNPPLQAMQAAARERGVAFLWDDDEVSVGMGPGSHTWPAGDVPAPSTVDWSAVHDVPVALVTGTNGKTTTVRLLAAMARAAGLVPGLSSTDGCRVGREEIGEGDYSGPGGARLVLRDRRVGVAILETARGGMLRRGLAVERAAVAIVTNVAEDHLGEWGVHDLDELVEAKLVVAKGTRRLVLNADDPRLRAWPDRVGLSSSPREGAIGISWFGREHDPCVVQVHVATGGETAVLDGGELALFTRSGREAVARLDEVPMTLGGAARHNVANALGAILVARNLGLPLAAIRAGLRRFGSSAAENPGRLNRFDLGGVTAIVDFAHNPHGLEALLAMARALAPERWMVLVGQAGDRDDEAIRELARMVWAARPDRVIVKELPKNLRGRAAGEVPALLATELRARGAPESAIELAGCELEAAEKALRWAREGDLLLLIAHEERGSILEYLGKLQEIAWRPGTEPPARADD